MYHMKNMNTEKKIHFKTWKIGEHKISTSYPNISGNLCRLILFFEEFLKFVGKWCLGSHQTVQHM